MSVIAQMQKWLDAKAESERSSDDKRLAVENGKLEAWEFWKIHAVDENRTLLENLNGRIAKDWPPEKVAKERKLFEEFWAEKTA